MADEEHKEPYHPDQDKLDMPDVQEHPPEKQCFDCDVFYLGRHTGHNPHKAVRLTSTGRCPDCQAKFDKRVREVGYAQAMKEEHEQTDSAHARIARYYDKETDAETERMKRENEERGLVPTQDSEGNA